jgi:hypothetical protein
MALPEELELLLDPPPQAEVKALNASSEMASNAGRRRGIAAI